VNMSKRKGGGASFLCIEWGFLCTNRHAAELCVRVSVFGRSCKACFLYVLGLSPPPVLFPSLAPMHLMLDAS
jgi:hypothetical protein